MLRRNAGERHIYRRSVDKPLNHAPLKTKTARWCSGAESVQTPGNSADGFVPNWLEQAQMDWNESLVISTSWKATCARCVHREVQERPMWSSVQRRPRLDNPRGCGRDRKPRIGEADLYRRSYALLGQ